MALKNNFLFLMIAGFASACSAQVNLGGSDAASKGIISEGNPSQSTQNSTNSAPVGQDASANAVSSSAATQPENPYTVEARQPKEIAGSFLTDLVCEFRTVSSLACSAYEIIDGQKNKIERNYAAELKIKVAGNVVSTVQGVLDNSYMTNFDLKNTLAGMPSDSFSKLKFEVSGDLDGQVFSPSFNQPSIQRCERDWNFPFKENGLVTDPVQGGWVVSNNLNLRLLGIQLTAFDANTPMYAKPKIYIKGSATQMLIPDIPLTTAGSGSYVPVDSTQYIGRIQFDPPFLGYRKDVWGRMIFFVTNTPDCNFIALY